MQVKSKLWFKSAQFRATFVVSLLVLWLAFALRIVGIGQQSIWFDEGWSAYAATQPNLIAAADADPTNPPLYYMLLNISTRFWGDSAFGLRLFSLFLLMLALALLHTLARMLFGRQAAQWALILAAFSAPLWWAAQEARMYTLMAVLLLLLAVAWHRLLWRPARGAWLLLVVAELLALYAHNTGPVLVLWVNVMTLLAWLSHRGLKSPPWRGWLASQIVVGLGWLPYFVDRFLLLQAANNAVVRRPVLNIDYLSRVWQGLWFSPWEMIGVEPVIGWLALAVLVLWLVLLPWWRVQARWLVGHILVLTGGLLVGLAVLGNELHGRYLVMIVPLLLIPLAAGIARLKPVGLRYGIAVWFGLVFALNMVLAANPAYQHDDARGMVQYYADTLTAEDSVLAWSYADRYDLWYYWDRLGVQAQRITLPEGADLDDIQPLLPSGGDVALNIWYTQRADFRGMMDCLLSQGTVNAPDDYAVHRMRSYLYHAPALSMLVMQPAAINISTQDAELAQIDAAGEIPATTAERAVCLPLRLKMLQSASDDLKAALIVRNELGWEISRTDAVFATANQRTTSALQPGETATAYVLLRLPFGAPVGDYTVALQVYDEQQHLDGYDLSTSDGTSRSVPLGKWSVIEGADWTRINRSTTLPQQINLDVSAQLRLIAMNAQPETVHTGDGLPLTLLWQGDGLLPDLHLVGDGWEQIIPSQATVDEFTLDWREIRIPLDVSGGEAALQLPDGTVLAQYQVEVLPLLSVAPDYAVPVDVSIPGVGRLVGYNPPDALVQMREALPVTLIWQAGDVPPQKGYTVFIQLLDESGQLMAQSDAIPGGRPTDGWRAGEYIVDEHKLMFNEQAHPDSAYLIVGMYDPLTNQRISLGEQDFIRLPGEISVE